MNKCTNDVGKSKSIIYSGIKSIKIKKMKQPVLNNSHFERTVNAKYNLKSENSMWKIIITECLYFSKIFHCIYIV